MWTKRDFTVQEALYMTMNDSENSYNAIVAWNNSDRIETLTFLNSDTEMNLIWPLSGSSLPRTPPPPPPPPTTATWAKPQARCIVCASKGTRKDSSYLFPSVPRRTWTQCFTYPVYNSDYGAHSNTINVLDWPTIWPAGVHKTVASVAKCGHENLNLKTL